MNTRARKEFDVNYMCLGCGEEFPDNPDFQPYREAHGREFCKPACAAIWQKAVDNDLICKNCTVNLEIIKDFTELWCSEDCKIQWGKEQYRIEQAMEDLHWERKFQAERDGGY